MLLKSCGFMEWQTELQETCYPHLMVTSLDRSYCHYANLETCVFRFQFQAHIWRLIHFHSVFFLWIFTFYKRKVKEKSQLRSNWKHDNIFSRINEYWQVSVDFTNLYLGNSGSLHLEHMVQEVSFNILLSYHASQLHSFNIFSPWDGHIFREKLYKMKSSKSSNEKRRSYDGKHAFIYLSKPIYKATWKKKG